MLGLSTIPVSVNGTVVVGSGVTAAVVGFEFSAVTFNGTTALPEGTTGFSEPTAVVPVGIAVLFAALPAALPAGEAVAALPTVPCVGMDTLDAGAFFGCLHRVLFGDGRARCAGRYSGLRPAASADASSGR